MLASNAPSSAFVPVGSNVLPVPCAVPAVGSSYQVMVAVAETPVTVIAVIVIAAEVNSPSSPPASSKKLIVHAPFGSSPAKVANGVVG